MGRLDGKIALITGTERVMGRTAALLFAEEGAWVVGCDMLADEAAETVACCGMPGARSTTPTGSSTRT